MDINQSNFQEIAVDLGASKTGNSGKVLMWAQFSTSHDAQAFLELCETGYSVQNVYPTLTRSGKAVVKFF